jgi:uncharacterized RDD family membrane protein YckC
MPTDPQNNPLENSVNPYAAPKSVELTAQTNEPELATRGSRFLAALVDGIVQGIVFFPIILIAFGGWTGYVNTAADASFLFMIGLQVASFLVFLLIHGYFLAKSGQTIGKKVLKIKIVRADGSAVDFQRLVLFRYLPLYFVAGIPVVGGLLYLVSILLIFRASHQCLHDNIADTIVVNAASESKSAQ